MQIKKEMSLMVNNKYVSILQLLGYNYYL